jgi:F0F1-type ATP synthase assembly protein I
MRRWLAAIRLISVGWYIAGSILLGVLAGQWLDSKLDTEPLFVISGLILGIVIAGYGVYQMLLPLISDKRNKENG